MSGPATTKARLAAAERDRVRQAHLLRATRREYQKVGKSIAGAEAGP